MDGDFTVSVKSGGRFVIEGQGFGTSGTVKFDVHQVETFSWSNNRIEGMAPGGLTGDIDVEVAIDEDTVQHGTAQM